MNLNYLNPLSDLFLQRDTEQSYLRAAQANQNSVGRDEDTTPWNAIFGGYGNGVFDPQTSPSDVTGIMFDAVFASKLQRISFYRSMAYYPLVRKALSIIADETVCEDTMGDVVNFGIRPAFAKAFTKSEYYQLKEEFDYVVNAVIKQENLWFYFYRWLIDAEQFWELCPNDNGTGLVGIKILPAFCTLCLYDDGMPTGYVQDARLLDPQTKEEPRPFTLDQVAYSNYGTWATNRNDIRGHLEPAIRPLNQLKAIEDALTVYRVTRAPERRIFNIFTGRLPPAQVEPYINKLKGMYRKSMSLDPVTGMINSSKNVQALTEDFWFSKSDEGNGSTVENMKGSTEFNGQMDDVKMFERQVMTAMMLPDHRWNDGENAAAYSVAPETSLSEIGFQKMCRRLGKNYCDGLIKHTFIEHLRLRDYNKKYLDKTLYNITFNASTDFEVIRQLAMTEKMGSNVSTYAQYLPTNKNSVPNAEEPAPLIAKQFFFKKMLGWTDEDIMENEASLKKEMKAINDEVKKQAAENPPEEGAEGGGEDIQF